MLTVISLSLKTALSACEIGEDLFIFIKNARAINQTMASLTAQVKAVEVSCKLIEASLTNIDKEMKSRPGIAQTQTGKAFRETVSDLEGRFLECGVALESLRASTKDIRTHNTNAFQKTWSQFKFGLSKESMNESRNQLIVHVSALNLSMQGLSLYVLAMNTWEATRLFTDWH
jgi:hypothetical protein